MSSYYNRPWQGFFEVLDGPDWMRYYVTLTSVEQGLALVKSNPIPDLKWRIVDLSGNVYESGQFSPGGSGGKLYVEFKDVNDPNRVPADVAARQLAYYQSLIGAPVHITQSERRRLLEESLRGEEDDAA